GRGRGLRQDDHPDRHRAHRRARGERAGGLRQGQPVESDDGCGAGGEVSPVRGVGRAREGPGRGRAESAVEDRGIGGRERAHEVVAPLMFEGFTTRDVEGDGATIHLRVGGSGPPLLLLHGNPLTHVMWHKIAPRLAERYTVVATDLRGYGDSSKPDGGPDHAGYSFRAMANDQVEVMTALGHTEWHVCGHDRGARVAHRMALDHPGRVTKVAFLDIVPTHHVLNNIKKAWA